eukprot:g14610.t1
MQEFGKKRNFKTKDDWQWFGSELKRLAKIGAPTLKKKLKGQTPAKRSWEAWVLSLAEKDATGVQKAEAEPTPADGSGTASVADD